MKPKRLFPIVVLMGAITCAATSSASAATTDSQPASSANWAGYVAGGTSGAATKQFSSVSASWVQPSANCTSGQGFSSFWVGLGGAGQQSQALEQVGTEADCTSGSAATHFAWYELVPAAPVRLDLAISPGDHVSGRVAVSGTNVTVSLSDQTTGASATKTLQTTNTDVSSAEWIAEAPSTCDGSGSCQPLPLADFGSVGFSNASATANGHPGTISDPDWTTHQVQLSGLGSGYDGAGFVTDQPSAGAAPSALSADGASFSVASQSSGAQSSASGTSGAAGGYPGDGTGTGTGTGYGYGGGSAYGDGYGGYGGYAYGYGGAFG